MNGTSADQGSPFQLDAPRPARRGDLTKEDQMRFIAWHMALAGWLLFSSFALPYGPNGIAFTALLAVLIGTIGLASPGLPGLRFVNTGLATLLAATALLMADIEWLARINSLLVALVVFALSVIPGRSSGMELVDHEPKA